MSLLEVWIIPLPLIYALMLIAGLVLVFGVLVMSGRRRRLATRVCPDPACNHRNQPTARYCARCGRELRPQ